MGFVNTSLIFAIVALVGTFFTGCCCNRGSSSKQLLHVTLFNTATVCCWLMWAIVYLAQMKPLIVPILNEAE